jgi:hypothetical protein
MTVRGLSTLVAICATMSAGCGTAGSYSPQAPGRIHIVNTESGRALQKNGILYSMSSLSNDPIRVVAGDPAAEEHARTYVGRPRTAGVLLLVGGALLVPAAILGTREPQTTGYKGATMGFAFASMGAMLGALVLTVYSRHHLYDAINVYNDNLASHPGAADSGHRGGP